MTHDHEAGNLSSPQGADGAGGAANAVFANIYDFNPNDFAGGNSPNGRLILDATGNIYGVCLYGGYGPSDNPSGGGVVFMLTPVPGGTYGYTVLHIFEGGPHDGARPVGGLTRDSAGSLYGTASAGGSGWSGTIFKLTQGQSGDDYGLTTLYNFTATSPTTGTNSDGAGPTSSLIVDANGTLFGTTSNGGANGAGTVFRLSRQADGSYTFTNLHDFGPAQGYGDTTGGLVMDKAGNLYGLKAAGGANASGEIFGLLVPEYSYKTLYSFPQVDFVRALAMGSLAINETGMLFGTTRFGGNDISGTVFSYPSASTTATPTNLYVFADENGLFSPEAGVILDLAGNLFGTASSSSPGYGAVYKLSSNRDGTYGYSTLFEFTEMKRQGDGPENTLTLDSVGGLFGTAVEGGTYGGGMVFRIGETAEAIAVMENGVVLEIAVIKSGRGYASPPEVWITPSSSGMTAEAVATVSNGSVTAVTMTNHGSGYNFGPQVGFTPRN